MTSSDPTIITETAVNTKDPVFRKIINYGLLILGNAVVGLLLSRFISLGYHTLAIAVFAITVLVDIVLLVKKLYPLKWMVIGLVLMGLFTVYPIIFTIWVAFTNYGEGHLITKEQALGQILDRMYLPEEGKAYQWTAFKAKDGSYALWLIDDAGDAYFAKVGEPITQPQIGEEGVGKLDDKGIPESIEGYEKLNVIAAVSDKNLPKILFGEEGRTIQVRTPSEAAELLPKYVFDSDLDVILDQETGVIYRNYRGVFTSSTGQQIKPGFIENIGVSNFKKFFTSPALRGPLIRIISWNFTFAFLSLFLNFALGLAIAILFNEPGFPFKKLIRSLLIIPYTVPALLTILVWRGMLNTEIGIVSRILQNLFGWSPAWFSNRWWAKVAILLINLWLSYPYFMLICSGSLQSISDDYYAAAKVDGANGWQQFSHITLPLLLVAVGPLLISSFVFNFNNFNLIYIFNGGGPPMANTPTPAGHTDILISYVYNLAFSGSRGIDYGFASAITMVIFVIVGAITLFQFRFTGMWEEVSENV